MHASNKRTTCAPCHVKESNRIPKAGIWSGVLLAILPKCPLCFVAFSGTALLCGDGSVAAATHTISSLPTILMTSVISMVVFVSVLLNYNQHKTPRAMMILVPGIMAVVYSATWGGGQWLYYSGVALMFFGTWMNGSFNFFAAKFRQLRRSPSAATAHTN